MREPVVFEVWEIWGVICYGAGSFTRCGHLTVAREQLGGARGPINDNTRCTTAITGPGVDHVRMGFTDGTLLQVATTSLHPALPVIELHAACWREGPSNAIIEIIAPDGTVIDRSPVDVPLSTPSP